MEFENENSPSSERKELENENSKGSQRDEMTHGITDDSNEQGEEEQKLSRHTTKDWKNDIDGGYGWVVVLGAFMVAFSTWGLNSAFSIYLSHYLNNDVFEGGTRLKYASIGGISFGAGLIFCPVINYFEGIIGTRTIIVVGGLTEFAALFLASYSTKLWQLYLTQGLLQSFGLALSSLTNLAVVSQWFTTKRQLANSIATSGSGAGGLVLILSMQKVIDTSGYQWGLRGQAIIALSFIVIGSTLIRTKTKHHKTEFTLYDRQVLQCMGFWIMVLYIVFCLLGYVIVLFSLANFTTTLGYSAKQGSIVAAVVQVGFIIGRPLTGLTADRVGPITTSAVAYCISAVLTFAMWIPARNFATVIAYGLLNGIVSGALWPTIAGTTARIVGMAKLNVSLSMLFVSLGSTGIFCEMIGLGLTKGGLDDPKAYTDTAVFVGVCFTVAAVMSILLRGYILARDTLEDDEFNPDNRNELLIRVPPGLVFKHCFTWTKRRA